MAAYTRCLNGTVEVPPDALNYNIEELRQELMWATGNWTTRIRKAWTPTTLWRRAKRAW